MQNQFVLYDFLLIVDIYFTFTIKTWKIVLGLGSLFAYIATTSVYS